MIKSKIYEYYEFIAVNLFFNCFDRIYIENKLFYLIY